MINIKCSKKLNSLIELYNAILKETIKTFDITDKLEINVEFVSRLRIKKINRLYRNINKVTDVLSYPYTELKVGEKLNLDNYKLYIERRDFYDKTISR